MSASRGPRRGGLGSRLTSPGGLFVGACLLVCAYPITREIRDPDFWWHLRAGELILDRHGLLSTDPFTYTASSHHWVMHEWLTEVLFALLHRAGGVALVVTLLSVVTWLGLLCIHARSVLPRDDDPLAPAPRPHYLAVGGGLVCAVVAGNPIWGPRAQMITFALTALLLWLVDRHLHRGGRAVWWLVPLFLVWSNLHSGFILGIGLLVVVIGAEVGGRALRLWGTAPVAHLRSLLAVLGACLVTVVINPNGPGIYLYPFETQGSGEQQQLIAEWHSPDFHDPAVRVFGLMLLSLAVMVVVTRRVRPRDGLLALVTTALSLQSERHIALFIAAATPLWIDQADRTGRVVLGRLRRGHPRATAPAAPPPRVFRLAAWSVLGALSLGWLAFSLLPAATVKEDSLTYAQDYPVCAARWLLASPGGLRIFNQYGEGGYLASRLSPHGDRVFIFGDAALMGDDLLRVYSEVETVQPQWNSVITDAGTDLVVFDTGTPLVDLLAASPRWTEVYRDPRTAAFVPATPAGRALAARLAPRPVYPAGSTDPCARLEASGALARA